MLDNYQDVVYSGCIVAWHQGTVGKNVTKILSRNLNEKPTDPLYNTEYIYSVTPTQNQFEVLSIYEGDVVYLQNSLLLANQPHPSPLLRGEGIEGGLIIEKVDASSNTVRIDGTYNGVYVKNGKYIIPTPSIITSLELPLELNSTTIKSQVIDRGTNVPDLGTPKITQSTGALTFSDFQVYSGVLNQESSTGAFLSAYQVIANTYNGSNLASEGVIKTLLSQITDEQKIEFTKSLILSTPTGGSSVDEQTIPNPYLSCISQNNPTPFSATTKYGESTVNECSFPDIIVCSGVGTGYTISYCNVGATVEGTDWTNLATVGKYFQWGRNDGFDYNGGAVLPTISTLYTGTAHQEGGIDLSGNATYSNKFIITTSTYSYNWLSNTGMTTDSSWLQGPCLNGYHVPTQFEWSGLLTAGEWGTIGANMQTALKIPYSGRRLLTNGAMNNGGNYGYYWSSSPHGTYSYLLGITSNAIDPIGDGSRAHGFSVRCFKN